jgi:hypothetical protein
MTATVARRALLVLRGTRGTEHVCVERGCGREIVFTNRTGWLHRDPAADADAIPKRDRCHPAEADPFGHAARRFGPPRLPAVDERPSVLMHPGCRRTHHGLGEVRRCAGGWATVVAREEALRSEDPGHAYRVHLDLPA